MLEDYYIDEIPEIIKSWNAIHGGKEDAEPETEYVDDPMKFFGAEGDVIA